MNEIFTATGLIIMAGFTVIEMSIAALDTVFMCGKLTSVDNSFLYSKLFV